MKTMSNLAIKYDESLHLIVNNALKYFH